MVKRLKAVIMLIMPKKPRWGGNPLRGKNAKSIIPVATKKAIAAS